MEDVIDLTGDEYDFIVPPLTKRQKRASTVPKLEAIPDDHEMARTGPVLRGASGAQIIDLCHDDATWMAGGNGLTHGPTCTARIGSRPPANSPPGLVQHPQPQAGPAPVPVQAAAAPRANGSAASPERPTQLPAPRRGPAAVSPAPRAANPAAAPPLVTPRPVASKGPGVAPHAAPSTRATAPGSGPRAYRAAPQAATPVTRPSRPADPPSGAAPPSGPPKDATPPASQPPTVPRAPPLGEAPPPRERPVPTQRKRPAPPPPPRAPGRDSVAERQKTWRLLQEQNEQLVAQREDLEGLDRASSLRFVGLVHLHNSTLDRIQDGDMAAREAAQHNQLTDAALQASNSLERIGQRTVGDLIKALLVQFGAPEPGGGPRRRIDLRRLGEVAAPMFHPARGPSVMLGPLDAEPKQRRAPQRRKPEPVAALTRPKEVAAGENGDQKVDSFTSSIMEELLTGLRETRKTAAASVAAAGAKVVVLPCGQGVPAAFFRPLVEVILDHAGFAQTEENNHAVGHLLWESKLVVSLSNDEQLMLAALTKEEHSALLRAKQRGDATQGRIEVSTRTGLGSAPDAASVGAGSPAASSAATAWGGSASAPPNANGSDVHQSVHLIIPLDMASWRQMCERVPKARCVMRSRVYSEDKDVGHLAGGGAEGGEARGAGRGRGDGGRPGGSGAGGSGAGDPGAVAGGSGAGASGAGHRTGGSARG